MALKYVVNIHSSSKCPICKLSALVFEKFQSCNRTWRRKHSIGGVDTRHIRKAIGQNVNGSLRLFAFSFFEFCHFLLSLLFSPH